MGTLGKKRVALVVAHPGHELRVLHWLESYHPTVFVLTDGSGRLGVSRIHSTSRILERAEANFGAIYGRYSDRFIYQAVLDTNVRLFSQLVDELSEALIRDETEFVLGDAAEGEYMVHDLWRGVRMAAVQHASSVLGQEITHFEFPVDTHPLNCPQTVQSESINLRLNDHAFSRKMSTVQNYPEIQQFAEAAFQEFGKDIFRNEQLFPVTHESLFEPNQHQPPPYELHGEKLVAEGCYSQVVRYRDHLWPIFQSLQTPTIQAA